MEVFHRQRKITKQAYSVRDDRLGGDDVPRCDLCEGRRDQDAISGGRRGSSPDQVNHGDGVRDGEGGLRLLYGHHVVNGRRGNQSARLSS